MRVLEPRWRCSAAEAEAVAAAPESAPKVRLHVKRPV